MAGLRRLRRKFASRQAPLLYFLPQHRRRIGAGSVSRRQDVVADYAEAGLSASLYVLQPAFVAITMALPLAPISRQILAGWRAASRAAAPKRRSMARPKIRGDGHD